MKRIDLLLTILLITLIQLPGKAQLTSDTLNGNSVAATLYDQGRLFNNVSTSASGYELPSGSGNHLIYNSGFWFAGTNQNGGLKLAVRSNAIGTDFYRGPYSGTGDYTSAAYTNQYQGGLWTVSKAEIIQHINDYNQPNYVAPQGIQEWPGNGDPNIGVADQLAPYVDVNNNNIYEPSQGDYPCIKGDVASYLIMHDDSTHDVSGGERIGAEIHMMVYQIASSDYIDSTTFIEVKVLNKGQNSFTNFKATLFLDGDIGYSEDEYIGSDPGRNLMYNYNGTNADPGGNGQPGYGSNPPSVGVVSLNNTIEYSGYFNRIGSGSNQSTIDPGTPIDYWNYMNGKWLDGSNWTYGGSGYGGTTPTQHVYDGNPYQGTGWTELDTDGSGTANDVGDRRFVMTSAENTFTPGDTLQYHYAVIANRRGDHLENVQGIIDYADSVQQFYNNMSTSCEQQGTASIEDSHLESDQVTLYPNPASNKLYVSWENVVVDSIELYSFQGRLVRSFNLDKNTNSHMIDVSQLKSGVYFVKVENSIQKLIIK